LAACAFALGVGVDGWELPARARSRGLLAVLGAGWLGTWLVRLAVLRGGRQ
jgi:hypothetical protein